MVVIHIAHKFGIIVLHQGLVSSLCLNILSQLFANKILQTKNISCETSFILKGKNQNLTLPSRTNAQTHKCTNAH